MRVVVGGALAVETNDLTCQFDTVRAVDGVNLRIPAGTIYGLLGPNGAGKTTTLHLLLGLLRPTRGTATIAGYDTVREPERVRKSVGALLEHHGLYERLNAVENLDFYGRIHRMPLGDRRERIKALLDQIGLWDRRKELVKRWSKGMKQKLAIARVLLHRPPIVFLDEPTAGHDPQAAAELRTQLRRMVQQEGATVLLTTHNLAEAEQLCGRIAILRAGGLVAEGTAAELRGRVRQPRVELVVGPMPEALMAQIRRRKEIASAQHLGGRLVLEFRGPPKAAGVVAFLAKKGVEVEEVRKEGASLEEAFLAATKEVPV